MRRWMGVLLVAALVGSPALADEAAAKSVTMSGEYAWDQGGAGGSLEAIFTPDEDGSWEVVFKFEFQGEPHTYTGSVTGSLQDGALTGEVFNESGKRSWIIEGKVTEGVFEGVHTETTGGSRTRTGTLSLGG